MGKISEIPFYIVTEQTSPKETKIEKVEEIHKGKLNYLRFDSTLLTFKGVSRNKRKWNNKMVKAAMSTPLVQETLDNGGIPGESGHPIPDTQKPTVERIVTIDPEKISHYLKKFTWLENDMVVKGTVETACDLNGPGNRLMLRILQGITPAFSIRAVIPQKFMDDGTIVQTGEGRFITFDHVFYPGDGKAYMSKDIPLTEVIRSPKDLQFAYENCLTYTMEEMPAIEAIMDQYNYDETNGMYLDKNMDLKIGLGAEESILIPVKKSIKNECRNYMRNFKF